MQKLYEKFKYLSTLIEQSILINVEKILHEKIYCMNAWFLEITFMRSCVSVSVCLCLCAPEVINNSGMILSLYDWSNNFCCISVL